MSQEQQEHGERLQRVIEALEEVNESNPAAAALLATELGIVWMDNSRNLKLFAEATI